MNIVEPFLRTAQLGPRLAVVCIDGQDITAGDLLQNVRHLAGVFHADGVRPGQRVIVVGAAGWTIVSTLALAWIGAVSIETFPTITPDALAASARTLEADVIYHVKSQPVAGATARQANIGELSKAARNPTVPAMWPAPPDALWHIAVSSGTTGDRKGIALTHGTSVVNVNLLRTVYPAAPGDRVLVAMTASMSFAVHNWLRCLYTGACAVFTSSQDPAAVLALLHGQPITHCMMSPALATALALEAGREGAAHPEPPPHLRVFSVGGARLAGPVQAKVRRHLCRELYAHYGATETQLIAVLDTALAERMPNCSGRLLPWLEAMAMSESGEPLPPGEVGRLRFRTPALANGYIGTDEDTARAFQDGWFQSQDIGSVSEAGIVRLQGRSSEVINIGGSKINPELVEEAILADAAIHECAVLEIPGKLGQPVLAAVIVDPQRRADIDALATRCRGFSANFSPRHVMHIEKLPRNESGKVMRGALRRAVLQSLKQGAGHA